MPGAHRKVWWRCPKGHSWQASVASRVTSNAGCPFCAGQKVLPGFNDLEAKEPVIASQWYPTLNGSFAPQQVTPGSSRRAWWLCENGHAWKSVISSRTGKQRCGCPVCAGRPLGQCTAAILTKRFVSSERSTWASWQSSFLPSWKTRSSGMCPSRIDSPCWWMPNGVRGKATGSLA